MGFHEEIITLSVTHLMQLCLTVFEVRIWGTPIEVFSGSQHPCSLVLSAWETDRSISGRDSYTGFLLGSG